jgi:hypothetical protein
MPSHPQTINTRRVKSNDRHAGWHHCQTKHFRSPLGKTACHCFDNTGCIDNTGGRLIQPCGNAPLSPAALCGYPHAIV